MSEIRNSRVLSVIHRVTHHDDWNSSFWTHSIPKYDSTQDKHCKRTHSRPRSSSIRYKCPTIRKSDNQLSILKEELVAVWDFHKVPYQHRELFYNSGRKTSIMIAKEIESLNKGSALIIKTLDRIKERERIISDLHTTEDLKGASYLLNSYRLATLDVFEYIAAWAQSLGQKLKDFDWNGENYIEKAKKDIEFLVDTPVGEYFNLKKNDLFLISPKHRLDSCVSSRISAVNRHFKINLLPYQRPKRNSRRLTLKSAIEITGLNEISRLFENQEHNSKPKKWVPDIDFLETFADYYYQSLVFIYTDEVATGVARNSYCEMLTAALSLHSSSILDNYLSEVLDSLIPEVEREALQEERNLEYVGIRDIIFKHIIESEVKDTVKQVFFSLTSKDIAGRIIESIDLSSLVLEAYEEEIVHSQEIVHVMCNYIIECFVSMDWLEVFAEGEIVQERLDNNRLRLPSHIQHEIFAEVKDEMLERTAENVYFGILNEFVGGFWAEGVSKSAIDEELGKGEMSIDEMLIIRDPNIDLEELKKSRRSGRISWKRN